MAHERCCPWWLAYTFDHPLRRLFQKQEQVVGPYLKEGMTALDLGCGMGFYSIAMARMVGPAGRVLSADLQEKMLEVMMRRARRRGVADRISPVKCEVGNIGVTEQADFALSMWMVHEVPDQAAFMDQVASALRPGALWLIAEPGGHVTQAALEATVELARAHGFAEESRPKVGLSRAVLLRRGESV